MDKLPYEMDAMKNKPMPSGLSLTDQKMYVALRGIYQQYKNGYISKETGASEKSKLMASYHQEKQWEKIYTQSSKMWSEIEEAAREYTFDSTIENADHFLAAVYNLPDNWRCERVFRSRENESDKKQEDESEKQTSDNG